VSVRYEALHEVGESAATDRRLGDDRRIMDQMPSSVHEVARDLFVDLGMELDRSDRLSDAQRLEGGVVVPGEDRGARWRLGHLILVGRVDQEPVGEPGKEKV
jgi:hypothetical protein